jgi:RNA polymerase sigma-70 factor (ECF subfamily)
MPDPKAQDELVAAAKRGDAHAFTHLAKPCLPALRSMILRMTGQPDDADDVQQEVLLRAFTQVSHFRGESSFKTWLLGIATHVCLDYLRTKRRWRVHAKVYAQEACRESPALRGELAATLSSPGFVFDAGEHIAFCFTCVGRSLEPEQSAAIILREVFGLSNREAADAMGVSEPVLRHHLEAARKHMVASFEGLCSLVSKTGVCYQCKELRDLTPEEQRGPAVPSVGAESESQEQRFKHRLRIVQDAPLSSGKTRPLHDLVFRRISATEESLRRP